MYYIYVLNFKQCELTGDEMFMIFMSYIFYIIFCNILLHDTCHTQLIYHLSLYNIGFYIYGNL